MNINQFFNNITTGINHLLEYHKINKEDMNFAHEKFDKLNEKINQLTNSDKTLIAANEIIIIKLNEITAMLNQMNKVESKTKKS